MFWHTAAPDRCCSLRGALSEMVLDETISRSGAALGSLALGRS